MIPWKEYLRKTRRSSVSELSALKMQTATFAKRRRKATTRRGIHPEATNMENFIGRESLKSKIKSLHGEAILGLINQFTKLRKSLHVQLCSLAFLKRCRDHQVIPKCFQLKNPVPSSHRTKAILRQASLRLIRDRISATKRNLDRISQKLLGLHLSLSNNLEPELWEKLDHITYEQAIRSAEARTQKQKSKYDRDNPPVQRSVVTNTVRNLSNQTLSPSEISILSKGHNFAITPRNIPTEEIISQIETVIYNLPSEEGNKIRRQTANILHKAKPPKQNISREERLALQNLRRNENILILPADKGNTTVVMEKEEYCNKIKTMLSDHNVYKKLKNNPTSRIEKKTYSLLKSSGLHPQIIKSLIPRESSAPRIYGLPKIHKESVPLRPIVSNIGGPTYQLARYLTKPLQKITGHNQSYIKNSMDFVNKINNIKLETNDILVSFDVVSLFTNVPVQDTLDIIKKSEIPSNLLPLIEHCLNSTYFQFQGEFFEQTSGAAMGSPISPIIANIFMEHFEEEIWKNAPLKPSVWFRYVDDTFVVWSHGKETLSQFLDFLNSQHPNIQFTMEIELNNQIPFLDVLIRRNEDGTLGHQVYRKPTHTDRYLHASSHHHPSQKKSVISSLIHRALTISEPTSLEKELKHLNQALTKNGYNNKDIIQTTQKLKNKISNCNITEIQAGDSTKDIEEEKKKLVFLPYIQGTTERIGKILSKQNIKVIFKPQTKISQLLPNPKDRRPPLETPGVYKIPCSCGKAYIGETGRKISTRIKEHQRCTKYGHFSQSALAEHWMETGHLIQYDKATVLAPSQGYFARKHREGLEIFKHSDNLNRDKGFQTSPIWHAVLPVF